MKKYLSILISAIMLMTLILSACGNTAETSPAPDSPDNNESSVLDSYPEQDLQIFVKASAGSANDRTIRAYAMYLEEILGVTITPNLNSVPQPIIYADLIKEPAGYAFCNFLVPNSLNYYQETTDKGWDAIGDYQLVCHIQNDAQCVSVRPDDERFQDCETVDDVFMYFINNPDTNFLIGVNSVGGDGEIAFYRLARFYEDKGYNLDNCTVVNTQGQNPANTSFIGGSTDILFCTVGGIITLANENQVRVVGVLSSERSNFLPDVPTAAECGVDIESGLSIGIAMSPDTSDEVAWYLSDCFEQISNDPEFLEYMEEQDLDVTFMPKDEYEQWMTDQQSEIEDIYNWVAERNVK